MEKMETEVGKEAGTRTGRAPLKSEGKEGLSMITAASQWLTGAGATQLTTQAVYVWGGAAAVQGKMLASWGGRVRVGWLERMRAHSVPNNTLGVRALPVSKPLCFPAV